MNDLALAGQSTKSNPLYAQVIDRLHNSLQAIEQRLLTNAPVDLANLIEFRRNLAATPSTTEQYSRAENHLQNAVAYLRQREFGAARYELATLVRQLRPIVEAA